MISFRFFHLDSQHFQKIFEILETRNTIDLRNILCVKKWRKGKFIIRLVISFPFLHLDFQNFQKIFEYSISRNGTPTIRGISRRKMEERRYIRLVNSCRSYPASYSRIDALDSGICPIQTRRRHPTFIWLDWMAPWLPVLPVTAKGSHTRGRIMYEWNGRDQLGQIKHLSCVGVSNRSR